MAIGDPSTLLFISWIWMVGSGWYCDGLLFGREEPLDIDSDAFGFGFFDGFD